MGIKLFIIAFVFFVSSLLFTDNSYSQLFDKEKTTSSFSASAWETKTELPTSQVQTEEVSFYLNTYKNRVGLKVANITSFDQLNYVVTYTHKTESGTINEMITGTLDNSSHQNEITEEWIILGTCSSGGICVYHYGIQDIKLQIDLVSAGTVQKTLYDLISL